MYLCLQVILLSAPTYISEFVLMPMNVLSRVHDAKGLETRTNKAKN